MTVDSWQLIVDRETNKLSVFLFFIFFPFYSIHRLRLLVEFFVYPLLTLYPRPLYAIFLRSYLVRLLLTVTADTCLFGVKFGVRELTLNFVFNWETRRASLFLKKETKQGNKETRTKQRTKAYY